MITIVYILVGLWYDDVQSLLSRLDRDTDHNCVVGLLVQIRIKRVRDRAYAIIALQKLISMGEQYEDGTTTFITDLNQRLSIGPTMLSKAT